MSRTTFADYNKEATQDTNDFFFFFESEFIFRSACSFGTGAVTYATYYAQACMVLSGPDLAGHWRCAVVAGVVFVRKVWRRRGAAYNVY
jgi:hypothetical protein